jgi:hypothetical protein
METSRKEQLEALIARGLEAQHFLQFIDKEAYFRTVFNELDGEYVNQIMGLDPAQLDAFRLLQTKRLALYEPMSRIAADVQLGQKASAEIDQPEGTGGIL